MRRKYLWSACIAVSACATLWAADWPSVGGNAQRDGWARNDKYLTKADAEKGKVKLMYKYKFPNVNAGLDGLSAPIDLTQLIGWAGFKELLFVGGSSNTLYSIDSDLGEKYFETKLGSKPTAKPTALCSGGQTASVVMPGNSSGRRGFQRLAGYVWSVSSDGKLYTARQQDGNAEYVAPVPFVPAGSKVTGLNFNNNVIYGATVDSCSGDNGLYAASFTPPVLPDMPDQPLVKPAEYSVTKFLTGGSGFSGTGGVSIGSKNQVYGMIAEGKGTAAGTYNDTVVALDPKSLEVTDWFTPATSAPALKKGVAGVTPAVFQMASKDYVLAGGRDGRLYLLDGDKLGGTDHKTAVATSEPVFTPDGVTSFYGNFATWEDESASNARWVYASVRGATTAKVGANGPAASGSIVAFKIESKDGAVTITQQWVSRNLVTPAAPIVGTGLVLALSTGEAPVVKKDGSLASIAEVVKGSKPATLYFLDAATGKEVWSSGTQITSFGVGGLGYANGRAYVPTYDNTVYAFGVPFER
ncbi:outer membrane protein assembly factor BamB family protein [Terriglobus tenax]|uniref:outer membrane protein assembly factor BamB family protein n=1 Tax=Terriglobus tenax TaxID=1111115 RepID=UPI0021E0F650|nr:PQQ-binding-like beta-propeller repeat protein [Terriglobus tenax]